MQTKPTKAMKRRQRRQRIGKDVKRRGTGAVQAPQLQNLRLWYFARDDSPQDFAGQVCMIRFAVVLYKSCRSESLID